MPDEAWELTECAGPQGGEPCGYMFIGALKGARRCNECGNNENHPRVCKVGGRATDPKTLLELARYTLAYWDVVNTGIEATVNAEESTE